MSLSLCQLPKVSDVSQSLPVMLVSCNSRVARDLLYSMEFSYATPVCLVVGRGGEIALYGLDLPLVLL